MKSGLAKCDALLQTLSVRLRLRNVPMLMAQRQHFACIKLMAQ